MVQVPPLWRLLVTKMFSDFSLWNLCAGNTCTNHAVSYFNHFICKMLLQQKSRNVSRLYFEQLELLLEVELEIQNFDEWLNSPECAAVYNVQLSITWHTEQTGLEVQSWNVGSFGVLPELIAKDALWRQSNNYSRQGFLTCLGHKPWMHGNNH